MFATIKKLIVVAALMGAWVVAAPAAGATGVILGDDIPWGQRPTLAPPGPAHHVATVGRPTAR